jgi:2,4-diketo-3-deoxy-L-fuconate hydrolase
VRVAVIASRTKIVHGTEAFDIAEASGGRFGPDALDVYDKWDAFMAWEESAKLGPGVPFRLEECDSPGRRPDRFSASV